ncbi:hypothetical protein [Spirosoma flavus]
MLTISFSVRRQPNVASADVTSANVLLIIDDNADIRTYIRSIFGVDEVLTTLILSLLRYVFPMKLDV